MTNNSSTTAAKLDLAAGFIARGWQVIVLHDVASGQCSCMPRRDGTECKPSNGGKHPRMGTGWQHAGLSTVEDVQQWLGVYPNANLGILTGPVSGMWALDVDPKNGGDVALAELERVHGPLPYTQKHPTGSGGWHLFFALPPDFIPGGSSGRLPPGLDVRGLGGQVVMPGSRTLAGDYRIAVDCPTLPQASGWLLDYIRPLPEREYPELPVDSRGLPVDYSVDSGADARLRGYAAAAVGRALAELAAAAPGQRGGTAYRVACSLIELCNSPWTGLNGALVYAGYERAAEQAMLLGGDFDLAEADASWRSAARHVGHAGRPVPPEREMAGVVDLPSVAERSTSGVIELPWTIPAQRPEETAGHGPVDSRGLPWTPSWTNDNPDNAAALAAERAALLFEQEVSTEAHRMRVREEAKRRVAAATRSAHDAAVARFREMILDASQLDAIPDAEPLIAGWLTMDTVARVSGPPGSYKSFVLLDMAAHVGRGMDWHGARVRQGLVLYLVAEGLPGMKLRRRAWEQVHGPMRDVKIMPAPVQTNGPDWDAFVQVAAELKPAMVVLDTQARITVGVQENDATDMGVFVDAVERLRAATGACVVLVHHTAGADSDKPRGSTSVQGAAQTELVVTAQRGEAVIKTIKQKDMERSEEFRLQMVPIDLGANQWGDPVSSLVPRVVPTFTSGIGQDPVTLLNAVMRDIFFESRGGTKGEVKTVVVTERKLMSRSAFFQAWNKLVAMGNIALIEGTQSWRYVPPEQRAALVGEAPGGALTTS